MKKYTAKIIFVNEAEEKMECDLEFIKRLNKIYFFSFSNTTTIKELYLFLINMFEMKVEEDNMLSERFKFKIGTKLIQANINYNLKRFLDVHNLPLNIIKLKYTIGIGGGNGVIINELAHIRINPNETRHKYLPHVHIFKSDYRKCIRINLKTFAQLKNDVYKFETIFSKKEIEQILIILKDHQQDFIEFYNKAQLGEKTPEFIIEYDNKEILFK